MQQFTVPQFIDVEDKIIGPITSRQFVIMLGTFMLLALNYKIFRFNIFLTISVPEIGLALIFSFIKVNGRPFHFFLLNIIQTLRRANLRIWSNADNAFEIIVDKERSAVQQTRTHRSAPVYQTSRLQELSLIVDTQGAYKGESRLEATDSEQQ